MDYKSALKRLPTARQFTNRAKATGATQRDCFMTTSCLRPGHSALIVVSLAVALGVEIHTGIHGQALISLAIWGLLLYLLVQVDPVDRRVLLACLVIATAGEIFLSLVWGLYTYRLHNIPPFVPPGHVLLLMLGIALAQRISKRTANTILVSAAAYALAAAAAGVDTLALPLLAALIAVSVLMPPHRQLYASTFMLSLVLELYCQQFLDVFGACFQRRCGDDEMINRASHGRRLRHDSQQARYGRQNLSYSARAVQP